MGTKGYRNTAKSGVKAASARRKQAVAKSRTKKKRKLEKQTPSRRDRI